MDNLNNKLNDEISLCGERCRECKYSKKVSSSSLSNEIYCDYYIMRGAVMRPCPAGDDCTEFVKADYVRKPNKAILLRAEKRNIECGINKYCKECGELFTNANPNVKRCPACIEKYTQKNGNSCDNYDYAKIADQLGYSKNVINDIKKAKNDVNIENIMHDARTIKSRRVR